VIHVMPLAKVDEEEEEGQVFRAEVAVVMAGEEDEAEDQAEDQDAVAAEAAAEEPQWAEAAQSATITVPFWNLSIP